MSSFDGASLDDLRAMIANADPSGVDAVASKWSAVHEALRQAQEDLLHHTLAATTHWQGAAADAFSARADELHQSLGNGAAFAFNASSGVSSAADSLRAAQAAMPAGTLTLEGIGAAQQATAAGVSTTQFDEHQRQQAVAVIRQLEQEYLAAGEMIGQPIGAEISSDRGAFIAHSRIPQDPQTTASKNHATDNLTRRPIGATFDQSTQRSSIGTKEIPSNSMAPPAGVPAERVVTGPESPSSLCSYYSNNKDAHLENFANQSIATSQKKERLWLNRPAFDPPSSPVGSMPKIPPEEEGFGPVQLPKSPYLPPQGSIVHRRPSDWEESGHDDPRNMQQIIGEIKPNQIKNGDCPAPSIKQDGALPALSSMPGRLIENRRTRSRRRPEFLAQNAGEWIGSCPPTNPPVIDC